MNIEFLHIVLIVGLFLAVIIMTIAIISTTLYTYRKTKAVKKYKTNKFYTAYIGENSDIVLVTFESKNSAYELMNAIYWAGTNGLNLNRVMYLDLNSNQVYRPNSGHFDMCNTYEIKLIRRDRGILIKHIQIAGIRSILEFEYAKKI